MVSLLPLINFYFQTDFPLWRKPSFLKEIFFKGRWKIIIKIKLFPKRRSLPLIFLVGLN